MPTGGALHTQGVVPIFSGHEVCLLDNVYPNSRSTWHSPPAIVRCPLAPFMQHSSCEGPWHRLKLPNCAAQGAGALRACSDTVRESVCKRIQSQQGWFGWGSGPNSAHNSSHVHVQVQTSEYSLHLDSPGKTIENLSWARRCARRSNQREFKSGLPTCYITDTI